MDGAPEELRLDGLVLRWDPRERVVRARYFGRTVARGEMAPLAGAWLAARVDDGQPFGILLDATEWVGEGPGWSAYWLPWFHARRDRVRVGIYREKAPVDEAGAATFSLMSGSDIQTFAAEHDALRWLKTGRHEAF